MVAGRVEALPLSLLSFYSVSLFSLGFSDLVYWLQHVEMGKTGAVASRWWWLMAARDGAASGLAVGFAWPQTAPVKEQRRRLAIFGKNNFQDYAEVCFKEFRESEALDDSQ